MSAQWYVEIGGRQHGPVSVAQLKQWAKEGRITPQCHVKKSADGQWVSAGRVQGLFADSTGSESAKAAATRSALPAKVQETDVQQPPPESAGEPASAAGQTQKNLVLWIGVPVAAVVLLLFLAGVALFLSGEKHRAADGRVKSLTLAVFHYAQTKGRWPDKLEQAFASPSEFRLLMKNPLTGDDPGYEYVKPKSGLRIKRHQTVVIYQLRDGKRDTSLKVGYADTSVRYLNRGTEQSPPASAAGTPSAEVAPSKLQVLHRFKHLDGIHPQGRLASDGTALFGSASWGGNEGLGTLYAIQTDGSGFRLLHTFTHDRGEGRYPSGSLTLADSTLYGTTGGGGEHGKGTLFSLQADGTGYRVLHSFGQGDDGTSPSPQQLVISGSTLYGATWRGGRHGHGTIFAIGTEGRGYRRLHEFSESSMSKRTGLAFDGRTLYGLCGGDSVRHGQRGGGAVFAIDTDGGGYRVLHEFPGMRAPDRPDEVTTPASGLTLDASTLYGVAGQGGKHGQGAIFAINTDGTNYRLLHYFAADREGRNPHALTLAGKTLFGTTEEGGRGKRGTVFAVETDGTGFRLLHEFTGTGSDSRNPSSGLTLAGRTLYGTTAGGPSGSSDKGSIFSIPMAP